MRRLYGKCFYWTILNTFFQNSTMECTKSENYYSHLTIIKTCQHQFNNMYSG